MCGISVSLPSLSSLSQIVSPENVTFVGAERVAAQLKSTVFAVQVAQTNQNTTNWTVLGTGFMLDRSNNTFAITCDHIVSAADRLFTQPGFQKAIFAGFDTRSNGYMRFECKLVYRDGNSDVAVLTPLSLYSLTTNGARELFPVKTLKVVQDMFGDDSSIVEGRGLLIIGYPLGLGIEANENNPIVRFGMVAQAFAANHNTFLIDGMASHGNSGSPVISLTVPHAFLIGMATGFRNESINLLAENGQAVAALPYNSGIAYAVKLSVILKDVDEAMKH